jgi:hypothetical protein
VIAAKWSSATVGDTVMLIVYGRSSDSLPELQALLSPVPGAKFSGNVGNAMLWDYNDIVVPGPGVFTATGEPNLSQSPAFTTPFNLLSELVTVSATITPNATVGVRNFGCQASVFDGVQLVNLFRTINSNGHAASNLVKYTFQPGVQSALVGGQGTAPIPTRVILPPGTQVRLLGTNTFPTDAWASFAVVYRQYNTLGKVAFT